MKRCEWADGSKIYEKYHDSEWGVPIHNDKKIFEFLVLEGVQAGLSWLTILKRRKGYKKAFANFNYNKVAKFTQKDVERLMKDSGIIRNRLKINSAITNAQNFIKVRKEFGSFDKYIWKFVGGKPKINKWKKIGQIPATSKESDALAKDLKKRGFKFVGSTIMYAHMQTTGMVNDHLIDCPQYKKLTKKK